jgi:ABC-2 type transport system permease protein
LEVVVKPRLFGPSARIQDFLRWSSAIAIASVVFLSVCVNVLGSRFDRRWDATSDRRYTLSNVTRETLNAIREPVVIHVLLSRADSMAPTVQEILAGYTSLSRQLTLRWVDPDRDPGQYLATQSELGIAAGASKGGKSLSDSIIVITRGANRSYVTTEEIAVVDPETGEAELRLEQSITRGIRQLGDTSRPLICFTQGHRELNLQDDSPAGLSDWHARLGREPVELTTIDLGAGKQAELTRCQLVVVAAPDIPLSTWAQQQLRAHLLQVGSLLVLSSTIPDESGQIRSTGLDALTSPAGVSIGKDIAVEQDESQRLPDGFGESFFAQVSDHAVTRALNRGTADRSLRVLVSLAPTLSIADETSTRPLLTSTDKAIAVSNISDYLNVAPHADAAVKPAAGKKLILAVAAELRGNSPGAAHRLIVAPASLVENRVMRLPALAGNRTFINGALTWLLARPVGVEIPSAHHSSLQLNLPDADLARLNRYVLLIMPATVAVLGLAVALSRRQRRQPRLG